MDIVTDPNGLSDPQRVGNKAANLAVLASAGFAVPPFFAINAASRGSAPDGQQVSDRLSQALATLKLENHPVAVRSSSVEEDASCASFAGQFDSFLDVRASDIMHTARKVMRSGSSPHVDAYREATGNESPTQVPAVLVQKMVRADAAGVAFAVDPVDGVKDHAVIAAVAGTGDKLVGGEAQGDTWRVDRHGKVVERELEGTKPVIHDRYVRRIARLVRKVSEHLGRPQDIEWAIEKGRLYLLQSRDITTATASTNAFALWDNSNIVESYGGVTTPLTFSVARRAYSEAYRHMGRVIGVSERDIAANYDAYEQMIGLIRGRVYYNILNWYRLLMLAPGFRFNGRFMEQMMGVTEGLPASALPKPDPAGKLSGLRSAAGIVRVGWRLLARLFRHDKAVRKFHQRIDAALAPVDLQRLGLHELIDYYETLQAEVIPAWDAPLVNDLYCMVFHGALRQLCERWLDEEHKDVHNELVSGGDDIISLVPVQEMLHLARIAAADDQFAERLCNGSMEEITDSISRNAAFAQRYESYLERFGDRCLDELKLESDTLRDDPEPFLRSVGLMAKNGSGCPDGRNKHQDHGFDLEQAFYGRALAGRLFRMVLRMARARVRDRENMRFERTRVYGRVRAVFVQIGAMLSDAGVLRQQADIFYLDVAEIAGFIHGTGISSDIGEIARRRRMEFQSFELEPDPPRRFITDGPPQMRSSMRETGASMNCQEGNSRSGQACSKGIVQGRVRIVRDPRAAKVQHGEILVARRTDPGWVTIFPLVSGMIMERGSLLSHSAIVARELGIPAVVGVDGACDWLNDGDWVELDGGSGVIRRIARHQAAA